MLEWVWFISLSFCGVILRLKKGDDGHYWFVSYGLMVLAVLLNSGHILSAIEELQLNLPQSGEAINTFTAWAIVLIGYFAWILSPRFWHWLTIQDSEVSTAVETPVPLRNDSLESIEFKRDNQNLLVTKNAISTLALIHAASEEKIIECLADYLWDENELKALQSLYARDAHKN